ncbi:MAG: hypothetical protein JSV05_09570 [Candidatus Bathyarchaeota archaeon]|nr:MAG: hypothetical protein JSV05_09570 [Candidatus Bathyarchaeota archaeon]
MCANELAEVRKLIKLLLQTQIAIERIVLRLETIKELSTIMVDLKPALNALKNVTTNLVNIMPDVASELDRVNSSIQETLTVTKLSSEPPKIIQTNLKTPGAQDIINEVNAILEQKLNDQLPEPPVSEILQETQQPEHIKEMVALVAGCPESTGEEKETSNAFLSIKDLKMQSISLRIQHAQSLEDKLLEYIKQCKGPIDISECALSLEIPPEEVKTTLENLDAKGKIILEM